MQIELDETRGQLVQEAVAAGKATDAATYVQSLIDQAAAAGWISSHREQIGNLLRDRLHQVGIQRQRGDFETLRRQVEEIVDQRRQRRAV